MKVGILGATGYTGQELLRILNNHPEVEVAYIGSSTSAGKKIAEIYPHLSDSSMLTLATEEVPDVDILFIALPHGIAAARAAELMDRGIKIIDLGADFRLQSPEIYEEWYKLKHPNPQILNEAVYGLPELYRQEIMGKKLIANPGCYPTASLLSLAPLLLAGLVEKEGIVIDAKSGVSGAGRGMNQAVHFAEVNENFKAYGVGEHRHTPEIEQQLGLAAGSSVIINFTPHLLPMTRGILVTIYVDVKGEVGERELRGCWEDSYAGEPFVHLLPEGIWPQTKYSYLYSV